MKGLKYYKKYFFIKKRAFFRKGLTDKGRKSSPAVLLIMKTANITSV